MKNNRFKFNSTLAVLAIAGFAFNTTTAGGKSADTSPGTSPVVLKDNALRNYVDTFNRKDHTHFGQAISNETTAEWMANNVPRFECPDKEINPLITP
jgi:hypothetical protein